MRALLAAALLALPAPHGAALALSPTAVSGTVRPGVYHGPALRIFDPSQGAVRVTATVTGRGGPYLRLARSVWVLGPGERWMVPWTLYVPHVQPGAYSLRVTFRARGPGEAVKETTTFRLEVV